MVLPQNILLIIRKLKIVLNLQSQRQPLKSLPLFILNRITRHFSIFISNTITLGSFFTNFFLRKIVTIIRHYGENVCQQQMYFVFLNQYFYFYYLILIVNIFKLFKIGLLIMKKRDKEIGF